MKGSIFLRIINRGKQVVLRRYLSLTTMAKSKFEYVKEFERDENCLPNCWIVIRIDGRNFTTFCKKHQFVKPNDGAALELMNRAAIIVMEDFKEIILGFGQSDEYSFVFRKDTQLYKRRASKLLSNVNSLFTSAYVYYWPHFLKGKELYYPPSFDARVVLYPTDKNLRDYLAWRQADVHINNLYNTCYWNLILKGKLTEKQAEEKLKGTLASHKNELLFQEFGINYNNEPLLFRKGTTLIRKLVPDGTGRLRSAVVPLIDDIIGDRFWKENPEVIGLKSLATQGRSLYLDAQATTPLDPRVLDEMMPYLTVYYGNPHSRTHMYGWETEAAVEHARQQVADLIGADKKEVVFTSGATECNNIAVKGVARFYRSKKDHIVTTQTEHKCVLDSCRALEGEGFNVTYIPVKSNGIIDLSELEAAIRPTTSLVSVMMVNNEIGVKQPIQEIGAICRKKKVFFHTDAAQAVGKIPIDVNAMNIDLMSISGHKLYGPKGIGALYVRRRPRVRVEPLQSGGGQERGIRSGTVPAPLAVGLGAACELAMTEMDYDHKYINKLSNYLIEKITTNLPQVVRNGDPVAWYPGCVNLSFSCVEGESLLMALKDVALSSGSACTSASLEPSYVLRAIGASEDLAHSSIRFGVGRFTTFEEVDYTAKNTIHQVKRLREMSPLWEMVEDGIDLKTIKWTQH